MKLLVEHCTARRDGTKCSLRGSADRYTLLCRKLCSGFNAAFSDINRSVVVNGMASPLHPRLGAFEVSIVCEDGGVVCEDGGGNALPLLIYSKLETRKWPCIKLLMVRIFAQAPLADNLADKRADLIQLALDAASEVICMPPPSVPFLKFSRA